MPKVYNQTTQENEMTEVNEMCSLSQMNEHGDQLILEWDPNDPQQHEAARKAVKKVVNEGGLVHTVEPVDVHVQGAQAHVKGRQIHASEFQPEKKGQRLLSRPAFSGG